MKLVKKAAAFQQPQNMRKTANNAKTSVAHEYKMPVPRYFLVSLLRSGTYGLNAMDTAASTAFWTDNIRSHISYWRQYLPIHSKIEKLTLPDGRKSRRKRYWLPDKAAAQSAIDAVNRGFDKGREYIPGLEANRLLALYPLTAPDNVQGKKQ